jgi:hypothetical protein
VSAHPYTVPRSSATACFRLRGTTSRRSPRPQATQVLRWAPIFRIVGGGVHEVGVEALLLARSGAFEMASSIAGGGKMRDAA